MYDEKETVKSKISLQRLSKSKQNESYGIKNIEIIWSSLQINFILNSLKRNDSFTEYLFEIIKEFEKTKEQNLYEILIYQTRKRLNKEEFPISILRDCIKAILKLNIFIFPKIIINKYYYHRNRNEIIKIKEWDYITKTGEAINSQKESFSIDKTHKIEITKSKHFEKLRTPYFHEIFDLIDDFFVDGKVNSSKLIYEKLTDIKLKKVDLKSNAVLIKNEVDIEKRLKELKQIKLTNNVKSFHFNLLMNNIMIEKNRYYVNKQNSKCQVCNESDEDFEHLFVKCKIAKIVNKLKVFDSVKSMKWYEWELENKICILKLIKEFIIWKFRCQKIIGKKNYNKELIENESIKLIERHKNAKWL